MQHIVTFSENYGWHEEQVHAAFTARGIQHKVLSLTDCHLGFEQHLTGIDIPGFDNTLPDAVFVRGVPSGSFEEVTFRLDILHALQASGVYVYNAAVNIERTVDKAMTSFLLMKEKIHSPRVWICESKKLAQQVLKQQLQQGHLIVQKPLFGNCGRGLQLIDSLECELDSNLINGIYYLQQYIDQREHNGRDWRVFVIEHEPIAAMERVSENWITNKARGGECLPAVLTPVLRKLAKKASKATGIQYGGVDIICDTDGNYMVLEVNSVPAWAGLQTVYAKNIAELIVDNLLHQMRAKNTAATSRTDKLA